MEYQKNDVVTLRIEDYSTEGQGIGKADGYAVFVKDTVIGDLAEVRIVKAKKSYAYGRLEKLLAPSALRQEPVCPAARRCGGCQLQAMRYEEQLRFKEKKVRDHLERIGGFSNIPMEPVIGMEDPYHYRNKAQFPVGRNREGKLVAGFYAGRTHTIIEVDDCALGVSDNRAILTRILAHMEAYSIDPYDETTGQGLVRHVLIRKGFSTGELLVCLVVNGKKLPGEKELTASLCEVPGMTSISLNVNTRNTNVILGDELRILWGNDHIVDRIGDIQYEISPLSFFQVNPVQTVRLYQKALSYAGLAGGETVWDLYCGAGTISLFMAQKARKVFGVEIIAAAVRNARSNAALNGFTNTEFFVGKAEEVLPEQYKKTGEYADVIVVDPPRKGCDETLLSTIIRMQPERVVYVSCDSATLARDLKFLCERGYGLSRVCPVDMFPQTVHCEAAALLERVSS